MDAEMRTVSTSILSLEAGAVETETGMGSGQYDKEGTRFSVLFAWWLDCLNSPAKKHGAGIWLIMSPKETPARSRELPICDLPPKAAPHRALLFVPHKNLNITICASRKAHR